MTESRSQIVGVLSGKGGVGKTNLVVNVAIACRGEGKRVLVVDGDLGLANVDVLLGMTPKRNVGDVLRGDCALEEAVAIGPQGIHVLPAASARADLASLRPRELAALLLPLFKAAERYELVLLDLGAGLGPAVLGLAACCDRLILVTTPEPTAFADAYATLKVLAGELPDTAVEVVVNGARSFGEARRSHTRLEKLALRFLGRAPAFAGFVPHDPRLRDAIARQCAVIEAYPNAPSSREFARLALRVVGAAERASRADSPRKEN
jgi:flagellar biosynthesis protein FlhG